ncbi:hypothetical protein [uncultured Gammaproteobacteria bacterium]|nr:hypothetical protein [uncultured Gammaproteobacteria bacterium]CAC9625985.1 hypothetical protein [uncultured Gammaproteobacteria bacterium]CAC9633309.1 hypothetical protein [uncultured Gammaproteobacteria bacterium]SSC09394.1 hypothetical protein BPUTEOSOX_1274 [thiotrophic endosymbiont of Bathymodiolus puteoserpentis (Logatchev)]VVH50870.1 hypothetical protein BPUTSESOX_485 [uncultured Gammaproteobacteria bacterium]
MSSRELEAIQEECSNRNLAFSLGITYDELCELQWETFA